MGGSADLESFLAHQHDNIILGTIEHANRSADQDVREMQQR